MKSSLSRASSVVAVLLFLLAGDAAFAQAPHMLLPVLTNETPMNLSNKFGVPFATVVNDAGDAAWLGQRNFAAFLRKANTSAPVRMVQVGDTIPGLPEARVIAVFSPFLLNQNGRTAVRADISTVGRVTSAILMFDGVTLTTVMTGRDTAPGTGGAKFERGVTLVDMNDNGDVIFGSTLIPPGSTNPTVPTLFYKPFGGAIVRVAGPADASPGTGGTFTAVNGVALNNSGQILFNASITGGSGATGIFVQESGVNRKIVATNDVNPLGGTFSDTFTSGQMKSNNTGLVVFLAGNSLWQNTAGGGTSVIAGVGAATPAPMGGTYSSVSSLAVLGEGGDAVFGANVTGGASTFGVFRFRSGSGTEVVARVNEAAPNSGGQLFGEFVGFSVNPAGAVSFQGNQASTAPIGIFQKPLGGALTSVVLTGAASPVGGTVLFFGVATHTTASGAVKVQASVINAPDAYQGLFLWSATPTTIMSTADLLPAGAQTVVRATFITAVGDVMGVSVQKAGGRESLGVLNPSSQRLDIAMTEGDVVPNTGGSKLQLNEPTTVMVSEAEMVLARAFLIGGTGGFRNAIVAGGFGTLVAVSFDGQVTPGGLTLRDPQFSSARPVSINTGASIAFTATVNNGPRGLFYGNPFFAPIKVAVVGDAVSTGQTITSINTIHSGITNDDAIIFSATTAAGQGLFRAFPGGTPQKIVQVGDAAPGGGTFSSFGSQPMPGLNFDGELAFIAQTSGGPGAGVYMAPSFGAPIAIALNGQAAPGGGTYVFNTVRPEALINNAGDISFIADVAGGPGDSGVFIKRFGLATALLARQGQAAPGVPGGVFQTFQHSPNSFLNERISMNHDGDVAFVGFVTPTAGEQNVGWWHADSFNQLSTILVSPSTIATWDGGTSSSIPSMSDWMFDRFPVSVTLANGPHTGGIYLYTPIPGPGEPTLTGTNRLVSPEDPLTQWTVDVTFANVTGAGTTSVSRSATGPVLPRGWYRVMGMSNYWNITTSATFTGNITVCIPYIDDPVPEGAVVKLLHYENGAWVDITTSADGFEACGVTTSLSPFVVAQALNVPETNFIVNGNFSSGQTNWSTFDGSGVFNVVGGVMEYSRPGGTAVVLQNTNQSVASGGAVVATWQMGNSSSERKRFSVLIHEGSFLDLSVCTFWLEPNTPLQNYAMRTHATIPWVNATISLYAASGTQGGGSYRLDNVAMGPGSELNEKRTDCVDPLAPTNLSDPDGAPMIVNGSFSGGDGTMNDGAHLNSPWVAVGQPQGTLQAQVFNGVAQFSRVNTNSPTGVLLQQTGVPVAIGQTVSATFQLGNAGVARKRVTVLLHDFFFAQLSACTFWLAPGQPLSQYSMRVHVVTAPWTSATISFYPATSGDSWFNLDNVTMNVSPSAPTYGTDCVEPGDTSTLGGAPAPQGSTAPDAELPQVFARSRRNFGITAFVILWTASGFGRWRIPSLYC